MESFFVQKKTLIVETVILIAFLGGIFYAYTALSDDGGDITTSKVNDQLLKPNLALFLKAMTQERISFSDVKFMEGELVKQMRDYSEIISQTETRGRMDPFVPYAATRPLR